MKYVITGSLGHISKPITTALLKAGHEVTVISSQPERKKEIEALGAQAAIGSVLDVPFLTRTFQGADAVYTMVPPVRESSDWKAHIGQVGKNYAAAIHSAGVQYVVNLSSIGAHMAEGCGPVSGSYRVEAALDALTGVHVRHLRPCYFYYNLFNNIGLIKQMGIMGSNFQLGEGRFPIVDPADIAAVATATLLARDFNGKSIQYIASDETSTDQIAAQLGNAIGKPDLKWVAFSDDQALQGMLQAGLPQEIASNYVEMGHAIHTGEMFKDYWKNQPSKLGTTKLADFAVQFAAAYKAS